MDAASSGGPRRYPWPRWHPSWRRIVSCAARSMPSAIVVWPKASAIRMMAFTSVTDSIVLRKCCDERSVDLQDVDREPLEIRKGRIPSPEVVDCYPQPECLQ